MCGYQVRVVSLGALVSFALGHHKIRPGGYPLRILKKIYIIINSLSRYRERVLVSGERYVHAGSCFVCFGPTQIQVRLGNNVT